MVQQVYAALTRVVVASPLPEAAWYSAAESALTAIYTLHPAPEHLSAAVLKHLARAAFAAAPADGGAASERTDAAGGAEGEEAEVEGGGEAPMDADCAAPAEEEADEGEEQPEKQAEEEQPAASGQPEGSQAPRAMHSVAALSRFFFALGHVALQHLVSGLAAATAAPVCAAQAPGALPAAPHCT